LRVDVALPAQTRTIPRWVDLLVRAPRRPRRTGWRRIRFAEQPVPVGRRTLLRLRRRVVEPERVKTRGGRPRTRADPVDMPASLAAERPARETRLHFKFVPAATACEGDRHRSPLEIGGGRQTRTNILSSDREKSSSRQKILSRFSDRRGGGVDLEQRWVVQGE